MKIIELPGAHDLTGRFDQFALARSIEEFAGE